MSTRSSDQERPLDDAASATLAHLPTTRRLGVFLAVVGLAALAAQLTLQHTYRQVDAPVALAVYGLESDPVVLREWLAELQANGTYLQMIRTEIVDLPWAVFLGLTIVSIYRFVGGAARSVRPRIAAGLVRWAPLAALGPAFDLVENAFSLLMLTDPDGFPDWWAAAHGVASRIKFAASALSAIVGLTMTAIVLVAARRARKPRNAESAVPPS